MMSLNVMFRPAVTRKLKDTQQNSPKAASRHPTEVITVKC